MAELLNQEEHAFKEEDFTAFICQTIKEAISERKAFDALVDTWWNDWRDMKNEKTFPFKGCYSPDTEALTDKGWVGIADIKLTDKVYSRALNGQAEYMPVTDTVKNYYKEMIEFTSRPANLLVSPDHNVYLDDVGVDKIKFTKANKLLKINGKHLRIPLTSTWQGEKIDKIYGFDTHDWMSFLGWYISEGYSRITPKGRKEGKRIVKNERQTYIGISQSQKTNPEKCKQLENLFNRMNLEYKYYTQEYLVRTKGFPKEAIKELRELGKCSDKFIPQKYLNLDKKYLVCLLNSLIDGDGCISHGGTTYYTTSKRLADNIQELVQKVGLRAVIRKRDRRGKGGTIRGKPCITKKISYVLGILSTRNARVGRLKRKIVKYNNYAYCVTTPYHTLYVRRNGIACWCGNCSNFSVPISSTKADAVIPRISESIFGINPPIEVKAMNKTAAQHRDTIKAFLNWDLDTHPEIAKEIWFFIQNAVWSGTGFTKSFMNIEREMEQKDIVAYIVNGEIARDPNTGKRIDVTQHNTDLFTQARVPFEIREDIVEKKPAWKKYNPDILTLDIKDVLFPSSSESIEDAWDNSLIAVRVWRTKDYLRRQLKDDKKELYKRLDKIKIKGLDEEQAKEGDDKRKEQLAKFASKTKKVECFEVYVNYDVDGDGLEEKVVAIVNVQQDLLFGWEKYPYKHGRCPIIPGYIKPLHNHPFGVGIPEMLYDTKGEIDAVHNQRVDRGSYYNEPILMHTKASGYNPAIHKRGVGRHWRLKDISEGSIRFTQPPKYEGESKEEEIILQNYAQQRSNVSDYNVGSESETNKKPTATGIMALIKESNIGFRNFTKWISLSVAEIFRQRFALYQQYWGQASDEEVKSWVEQILDIPDNPLSVDNFDAINQQFNIVMTATKDDINVELTKAQLIYDVSMNHPLFQQVPTKTRDAIIELFRKAGIQNPESLVPTVEEIKNWQAEVQAEALRMVEQEKAQANVEEAEKKGFDTEMLRQEASKE